MLVGISVVGVVTASVAAWLIANVERLDATASSSGDEPSAAPVETTVLGEGRPTVTDVDTAAELPFNCEYVVPPPWFDEDEPMRGDPHRLFAFETQCNRFCNNTGTRSSGFP